ncbi:hypothetical protein TeGR_g10932 [Tetraparma gracilis]|uniref:Vacuolar protein-sorting-associated protein 36 n=1 Tax=Tetraparma gracilis TaxID=2962635 RepID=A0ABQ6NCZ7_9STRA|nr:hypothetical protein TeGR_g10932 [Tetraparma gracilis]
MSDSLKFLYEGSLTPSSLPSLVPAEVIISTRANVSLRLHVRDSSTVYRADETTCTLTTHRLLFSARQSCRFVFLREVLDGSAGVESQNTGFMRNSPKISFGVRYSAAPAPAPDCPSSLYQLGVTAVLKFEAGADRDFVFEGLQTALSRAGWAAAEKAAPAPAAGFSTSGAGIGGIIKRKKEEKIREAKLTDAAFGGDLDTLMESATAVVAVVEKYVAKMERQKAAEGGGGAGDEDEERMNALLQGMGMVSGVTKESAGTLFHSELSKELAAFLNSGEGGGLIRARFGGLITLPELYCLYNRARGADLISPEDLLLAAQGLKKITTSGMSLVTFPSGVIVVQVDEYSSANVVAQLQALCKEVAGSKNSGITALEAAKVLKATPILAMEMIRQAEAAGALVRDEDVEGALFWENKFDYFHDKQFKT